MREGALFKQWAHTGVLALNQSSLNPGLSKAILLYLEGSHRIYTLNTMLFASGNE